MIKRVCQVCNGHPVDDGRVFHRTCLGLAKAGYEVHLIAIGKGTKSYSDRGVTIHPLPECRTRRQRFARRSRVAKLAAELRPDIFHVHEPDLLGPVLAYAGSQPVIYDVHESFMDILTQRDWIPHWLTPLVRFVWDQRERYLVKRCSGIAVVTAQIAKRYHALHKKVRVISNYPKLSEFEDLLPVARDGKTCVFAGILSPDRGLTYVFEALAILKARGLSVRLELAGIPDSDDYLSFLWREAERLAIRDLVHYHGILSRGEALQLQHGASIGLVPYLPLPNSVAGLPTKLVECMALGIPVVFSDFPRYREVAGETGAGIAVDPTSPIQIANAIENLVQNPEAAMSMGEAGKRAVREKYNWNIEQAKLLELYQEIQKESDHK